MNTLKGEHIRLRALEPEDLNNLYQLENEEQVWEISNTSTPYSKYVLKQYLEASHRDIFEVKQLRLVVCMSKNDQAIGFIDLFDFDPKHKRVGIGIIIFSEKDRQKGHAFEAVNLLCNYAFVHLNVHQVYANITEDNLGSIQLFEKLGFKKAGTKKEWMFSGSTFKDELIYQRFNHVY